MKIDFIQEKDKKLANVMKALGNPVRLAILRKIIEKSKCPCGCDPCYCGEKCEGENCKCGCKCGELVNMLPMAQSTISQHLKELKEAGIIKINGRKGDYTLNYQKLKEVLGLLEFLPGFEFKEKDIFGCEGTHKTKNSSDQEKCHCQKDKNQLL